MEVNDSLFDVNESLIRYQSEEIKFLRDEINNKNLIIKTLLKNLNDQNFSYRSDFNNFDNSFKNSKSQDKQFIKPKKTAKKKQFKDDKNNYASPNKYESLTIKDSNVDDDITPETPNDGKKEDKIRGNTSNYKKQNNSISKIKKKAVVILRDSIVKNVNGWQLSKSLTNEKVSVKSFPGATTKQMSIYLKPTLEEKPDTIILHMGTNDLRSEDEPDKIANDIVDAAVACKQTGCEVIISALLPRGDKFSDKAKEVNDNLKELCLSKNISLIEHRNFHSRYHLNNSKLHPNRKGSGILASNF